MDEIIDSLAKLHRKVDKLNTILVKIAKVLHLLPVTEKEERALQALQRENLAIAAQVTAEMDAMREKDTSLDDQSIYSLFNNSNTSVFGDVIADDFLGGDAQ